MIKESKDKQREKNGSTTSVKTELPSSQGQSSETTVKEEPGTESHVNGGEEGDSSCKKNGVRVSGGNGATGSSSSCGHADIKPSLIGSTNTGTVTMGPVRSSSATHITSDLCMVDGAQEGTKPEESSSQDKPTSCNTVKTEINGSTNHEFSNADPCSEGNVSLGISLSSSGPPPNGVQPLPSNVINKQPGTMEAQYMQQQSQIFVFSTTLANKSAEAVLQGQFPSIIAYHCAQPGTKKYLEKHPLKMNQFNRQNPAQWLNSLAQMKQKAGPGVMKGLNPGGVQGDMGANPSSGGGMGIWNQNNNIMNNINTVGSAANSMMQSCANSVLGSCPVSSSMTPGNGPMKTPGIDSPCMMPGSPNSNPMMSSGMGHHSPSIPPTNPAMMPGGAPDIASSPITNPNSSVPQPTLTGVKVPDENLTPQQRQHREEQLATLRKMQQMLFPEHQSPISDGGNVNQQPEGMLMQHGIGPVMGLGPGPGPGSGPSGMNNNGGPGVMTQKGIMMGGLSGPSQITPNSVTAQLEWQKLQHQFYEERKKKGPSGLVMGGSGSGIGSPASASIQQMGPSGPGSCGSRLPGAGGGTGTGPGSVGSGPRAQGPPPPYHQTTRSASVPNAMPSPNPASPNNPTSNLSLPSPRAASGLNSPADPNRQQFSMGGNGNGNGGSSTRLVGSGPSPTGTHSTSLESPTASRPLNLSNPGTPVSTHLSPSAARKESSSEFPSLSAGSSSQPNTTTSNQQPAVDGMYCRTLQSMAQQKQQQQPNQSNKEPNLMPVPSPQQIQYLNTFDGQELTIQKQPNTSLKDTNIRSPTLPPPSLDSSLQTSSSDIAGARISGPGTPLTPTSMEVGSRYSATTGEMSRFPIPSPHTPGAPNTTDTKSQPQRFPGPSPQNQGTLTPGMDPLNKAQATEVGSRFLSSSPQMVDGMGPPRLPVAGSGPTSTSPAMTNPTQNFMQQTAPAMGGMKVTSHFLEVSPSGNTSSAIEVSPTGSGSFPCMRSENVPLNPNGNSGIPCNGKSTHFDPITSLAQMSQQLTSSVANSPGGQNPGLMNNIPAGMLPFNSNMHPMQMTEMGSCQGLQDGQTSGGGLMNTMGPGVPGSQSGPANFVGMPPHSFSPNGGMVQCSGSVSTTPSMSQPIMHANSSASPKPGNMIMGLGPSRGSSPYTSSPVPQRMIGRPPGPNLYSGTNVQVKASAPNTIQYIPAKPQTGSSGPRGPPSLDFLQRFTSPLSNLDTKVPTHNLQYFPTSGQPNSANMGRLNVPMNRPNGAMSGVNSQIGGLPGTNCGGHMGGLNGPIIGSNVSLVGMNLPMSGGMVMGSGGPCVGMTQLRGSLRPGGMMRMQQMGGSVFGLPSSPGQTVGGDQIFGGGPNQNMPGNAQNTQMFVPGSKSSPMGLGSTPDASQPLPPSMGQANNFKNSPFIGPTTADPNYAQQFHNFQQQLYATNTRSQMNNQGMGPNQSFFVPK